MPRVGVRFVGGMAIIIGTSKEKNKHNNAHIKKVHL